MIAVLTKFLLHSNTYINNFHYLLLMFIKWYVYPYTIVNKEDYLLSSLHKRERFLYYIKYVKLCIVMNTHFSIRLDMKEISLWKI